MASDHVTVGIFYELPNGQIAYTYGFDGKKKVVNYRFDGDTTGRVVTYEEIKAWNPRPDLNDFPNASDPKLPYIFDLNWDIQYMSDLRRTLASGHPQLNEIKRAMRKFKITV